MTRKPGSVYLALEQYGLYSRDGERNLEDRRERKFPETHKELSDVAGETRLLLACRYTTRATNSCKR